ncbi:MAG: hypothetical protein JSR18_02480 [Proteobacteria bacterium]|nr:hypothetical protein [Pseudomonadota bacterium]
MLALHALLALLTAFPTANARAQTTGPAAPEDAAPPAAGNGGIASRFIDPRDGQLDVSEFLEHAHGFLPIPIVITEPAIGYGGGLAGMFLRPRSEAGEEGWSRPDISAIGAFGTQNGTWGAFAGDVSRWMDGRLRTLVGVGTGRVNLDFYGLGADTTSLDQGARYSLDFTGAVAQANWQLAPHSPWAVGIRYVYATVDPILRDEADFPDLANRVRVNVSAPSPVLEYDTRDNIFTPTRGIYSESSWVASRKAFGSTDDFDRFTQVLMGWYPVSPDVIVGARGNYSWSSSGTPFFLRPFVQLRGVPAMRYQGDQAASVEVEGRWRFHGRWSVVAFGGGGATRSDRDAFTATQNVGSGGAGIRYTVARKFGMDVGMDVAHSPGTTAVYLVVGNAWFRP